MTWNRFFSNINEAVQIKSAHKAILLAPKLNALPLPIQRYDEPFYPFSKEIIQATKHVVSAYIFDFASYLATGGAGVIALERSIRYAKDDAVTILHGPFVGTNYSVLADEIGFCVDALTIARPEDISFYLENPPYAPILAKDQQVAEIDTGGILTHNSLTLYNAPQKLTLTVYDNDFIAQYRSVDFAADIKKNIG